MNHAKNTPINPINMYGDAPISTTGVHGHDISSQRVDDLDLGCLAFVEWLTKLKTRVFALDIGGGLGAQSKRMATHGANVVLVDLSDQSKNIARFNETMGREAIRFHHLDVRDFIYLQITTLFDVIYSQRMLGCIRHREAVEVISTVRESSSQEAHFFFSTGGLQSELGQNYSHQKIPVEQRWGSVSSDLAKKHQIFLPECLYSELELTHLVELCGLSVIRSWTSKFGNPKVICKRATT
jgi:cyclopropane fatty-acyl-phospholipid synthase-like methyltransferase